MCVDGGEGDWNVQSCAHTSVMQMEWNDRGMYGHYMSSISLQGKQHGLCDEILLLQLTSFLTVTRWFNFSSP